MPTTKKKKKTTKALVKKEVGRPTVITEEVVRKLESVFKLGVKDNIACNYAGIPERTYYENLQRNEDFRSKMRAAQNYARIAAGNVVMDDIVHNKDVQTAKWWLEKKHPDEFGNQPLVAQQFNVGELKITRGDGKEWK
ncbi:MAG: hypothetical protein FJZ04_03905 [Candidatus Moranbacteria bacterium]|nr:hypothetical protein [Candidatus Moranbacteria bacterium]